MNFRFVFFTVILLLTGKVCHGGDPVEELTRWLNETPSSRSEIAKQSFAVKRLTKEQAAKASDLLLKDFQNQIQTDRKQAWTNKVITLGKLSMKFDYKIFGKRPKEGRSLFISMHGGGGAPAQVNDQQW
ncbi:MAG: alpha/beta hydrolase, partial [Planctomycetota bacterium]|nr:alpha/beta hydrolase [Planctomycetota bacterium]